MLINCLSFILSNKFYFIIELLIVILHIFVMIKSMKKYRKSFLHIFFGTAVMCIILDIIYHIYDFDLSHDMNILQKIFHLIFSWLGAYAFFLIATISLLYMVAFLMAYIALTIHEKKQRSEYN